MAAAVVVAFGLVLARVGAFVAALPLFGGQSTPVLVKVGLALAVTLLLVSSPAVGLGPAALELAQAEWSPWLSFGLAVGRELLLGALLGYGFGLVLLPPRIAGEFLSEELGLAFGTFYNPAAAAQTSSLTTLFDFLGTLVFLGLDGHHIFFAVLESTFDRYPLGAARPQVPVTNLVSGLAAVQEWGLVMAAPVGACVFLTTVVLALMSRAAPQLNIFSVGFALRLGVGLVALVFFFPEIVAAMLTVFGRCGELLLQLV